METNLLQKILEESVWIGALLGGCYFVIRWLAKRYEKVEQEKSDLAKEVIKLTSAYEAKLDGDKDRNAEIRVLLAQIRDHLQEWTRNRD